MVLLAVSHFTGCLWFAIGARDTADSTWVDEKNYRAQGRLSKGSSMAFRSL